VDHPTSLGRQYPWRTTALVAAALAALELILLVIILLALLAKPLLGDEASSFSPEPVEKAKQAVLGAGKRPASTEAKAASAAPELSRSETLVIVLNGNGTTGAASEKADLVRTKGYLIAGTANAPRTNFPRSVVMFRPGHRGEAVRLARDFGVARVAPLDGLTASDLLGAHVALIVGES
jgi:LytR cell envelope-related transcriptional attenuator